MELTTLPNNPLGRINVGYLIVSAIQFPNPGDWYLWRVMGVHDEAYAIWTYNVQTDGFAHGHYFGNPQMNNRHRACHDLACWYVEQLAYTGCGTV